MQHTFHATQWVPYPVSTVFAFFADPQNLPPLMPAWQKARVERSNLKSPPPPPAGNGIAAGAGSRMTISFRPFPLCPVRMKWEAEIVEFVWNDHFCDEQPRGPFAYWRHCHRIEEAERNGTAGSTVIDDLVYELPFGFLSEPAHALLIRGQIRALFRYRQHRLLEQLAARRDSVS